MSRSKRKHPGAGREPREVLHRAGELPPGLVVMADGQPYHWRDAAPVVGRSREFLDGVEAQVVPLARAEGVSWERLGGWLGVSGEGLRRRYGGKLA